MENEDNYNIDSDDSDEPVGGMSPQMNPTVAKVLTMEDFEELKRKTLELVDPEWKKSRNEELLGKMLALDAPTITSQMVEFLAQQEVCALLLSYVTQRNNNLPRPALKDEPTEELKMAHKVMMLLTSDDPSDGLKMLLSKRATLIMTFIMDVFEDDSAGSFYHAYRIIDLLLRCYPLEVLTSLTSDGDFPAKIMKMLRHIGYPPVAELLAVIITMGTVPRGSVLFSTCEEAREDLLRDLVNMNFFSKLVQVAIHPEDYCVITENVSGEIHSQFASQLFQECIEKLSHEEEGEWALQPIGDPSADVLRPLLDTVLDSNSRASTRRGCARSLEFLCRQASEPELMSGVAGGSVVGIQPSVPNRLFAQREAIIQHLSAGFVPLLNLVTTMEPSRAELGESSGLALGGGEDGKENFVYPTHSVLHPMSTLRIAFFDLLVLLIESDADLTSLITAGMWRQLISWAKEYAHNNVYHAILFRIIYCVLRHQVVKAQNVLLDEAAFIQFLSDVFLTLPHSEGEGEVAWTSPPKGADPSLVKRFVMRGFVMNCGNAIRLQALSQHPSSFIRHFLEKGAGSATWALFLPKLMEASVYQMTFGMGITVNGGMSNPMHNIPALSAMVGDNEGGDGSDPSHGGNSSDRDRYSGLGHGTHFARNLGFYDDLAWDDAMNSGDSDHERESGDMGGSGSFCDDTSRASDGGYNSFGGAVSPEKGDGEGQGQNTSSSPNSTGNGSPNSGRLSGDRSSGGVQRLSGGGYQRSPLGVGVLIHPDAPAPGEDEDSDVIDGILGPSSPAAQKRISEGKIDSPLGPTRDSNGSSPGSRGSVESSPAGSGHDLSALEELKSATGDADDAVAATTGKEEAMEPSVLMFGDSEGIEGEDKDKDIDEALSAEAEAEAEAAAEE